MTLVETSGTVAELQSELDALQRRIDALTLAEQQAPSPFAAGLIIPNIPPTVAPGQLIASSWGNSVVNALTALDTDLGARFRIRAAKFSVNTDTNGMYSIANANASPFRAVQGLSVQFDRPLLNYWWGLTPRQVPINASEMSPNGLNIEGRVYTIKESGGWANPGVATFTGWYIIITSPT